MVAVWEGEACGKAKCKMIARITCVLPVFYLCYLCYCRPTDKSAFLTPSRQPPLVPDQVQVFVLINNSEDDEDKGDDDDDDSDDCVIAFNFFMRQVRQKYSLQSARAHQPHF